MNNAFRALEIPLRMKYTSISEISNSLEYLSEMIRANYDIAVCFNYYHLYDAGNRAGHVSLVDKVDAENQDVRLIDPGFSAPKWRVVSLVDLVRAIEFHGVSNSGGFWEFRTIERS